MKPENSGVLVVTWSTVCDQNENKGGEAIQSHFFRLSTPIRVYTSAEQFLSVHCQVDVIRVLLNLNRTQRRSSSSEIPVWRACTIWLLRIAQGVTPNLQAILGQGWFLSPYTEFRMKKGSEQPFSYGAVFLPIKDKISRTMSPDFVGQEHGTPKQPWVRVPLFHTVVWTDFSSQNVPGS